MRKGSAKYIFLGLVVFMVLCFLASPMPMGKIGQSFENRTESQTVSLPRELAGASISQSEVLVFSTGTSGNSYPNSNGYAVLANTYTVARTMIIHEVKGLAADDAEDWVVGVMLYNTTHIFWERGDDDIDISVQVQVMEFAADAGVNVYFVNADFAGTSITYMPIGDTLTNDYFVWNLASCDITSPTFISPLLAHAAYPYNTTHFAVREGGSSAAGSYHDETWFQIVEIDGMNVQYQHAVDISALGGVYMDHDFTSSVDTTHSFIYANMWNIGTETYTGTEDGIMIDFVDGDTIRVWATDQTVTNRRLTYQVIEFPDWVTVQHIQETGMDGADTTEDTTITAVVIANSITFHMGATHWLNGWGGTNDQVDDDKNDVFGHSTFTTTTNVRYTRQASGAIIDYTVCVIEFGEMNTAPVNDQTPECTNLDDTDNLYARYKIYNFSVSVTDADGATDTNYVELSSMNGATPVWTVKYLESDNSFSETAGTTLIELTGSVYTKSGINLDIWFGVRIEWAHADANDYDLKQYVVDDAAASDTDTYSAIDYDYDTDVVTTFALNDGSGTADHGNYNSIDSITATGTVSYEDSGGNNYPPTDEADVFIECSDIAGQPWSDLTLSSGAWSMTVDSDDVTGTDTYWVSVVAESGGVEGTQYNSTSVSDTYIADALTITITGPTDNRQNLNANATGIIVSAVYDEGGAFDGTLTLNNTDYNGDGTAVRWDYTVDSASGDTYGVTSISTNDDTYMIWDSITITITGPTDNRQNLNANASGIVVSAVYDYDSGAFDGSFTMNNSDYNGDGTAVRWDYTVSSVSGDTHGITTISSNDDTYMIWDSLTITITGPTDNRQNLNANASGIIVSAVRDYDSSAFDGTLALNNTDYNGDGTAVRWDYTVDSPSGGTYGITTISSNDDTYMIWDSYTVSFTVDDNRINIHVNATVGYTVISDYDAIAYDGTVNLNYTTYNQTTAQRQGYTVSSLDGDDTYAITSIGTNDDDYVIWDSLTVSITNPTDQRININANASGMVISAVYDYDSTTYDGTLNLNDTDYDRATAIRAGYKISSADGDDTHGISVISDDSDETYCIWDSLTVTITGPTDNRQNLNANASGIVVSAVYDYDSEAFDGTFTLNNTDYNGDGTAVRWDYTVDSVTGDTHGITTISSNDDTYMIWDSLTITITGPTDNRQNLNANASGIGVSAIRDYDSSAFDGTFTFNATDWDGDGTVVRWGWTISSVSGGTYGITTIGTNDDTYMIWDQIKVLGYMTNSTDNHDNINDAVNISVWIQYDYDDTNVTDGTIVINGESYVYNAGSGNWTAIFSNATASSATWNTAVAAGNTHGITSVNQNSKSLTFKWDSLTIVMGDPTDQRQNLNANASGIVVSATYDLGGAYDGTLGLNNTDYDGDGTVVRWDYEVDTANGDDTYAITAISDNSDTTYMIWDRIIILTTTTDDSRIDINTAAAIAATAKLEYDNHALGTGDTLYMNDTSMSWNGSHFTLAPNFAVVDIWNFFVNSSSANEATYGITLINLDSNNVNQIWDSLTVTITNPTDQRININANASGMVLSAIWDYDSETYDGTLALNDTTYDYGSVGIYYYTVTAGDGDDTHGITVVSSSDSVYCIFDRILILTTTSTDSRIDYGTTTTVNVTAELEYDSHTLGTDDTLYMNGTEMTWDTDHFYLITGDYNIADIINYFVNSTSANEDTYGITVINLDGNDDDVIWDSYTVAFTVDDNRININTNATVGYTVISDYDSIAYDGTVNLNYTTWEQATAQRQGFTVSSLGGDDTYGITVIGTNDDDYMIWDSITITITGPTDNRQNINANASGIIISAIYDYDSEAFDGTFTLNNTDYNGDGTAVRWDYTVQSVTGDTHGITTISTNDDTYMIWDSYTISFTVDDNRININVNATVGYTVISDYDSIAYDGTVNLNYTTWERASVQRQGFTVSSLGGDDTYGITSISTNDDDHLIWDAIGVNMWIDDGRDNIDDTITVYAWLSYTYDMTNVTDGTVLLNGTGMSYGDSIWSLGRSQAAAGLWAYNITSISGNTHGITTIGNVFSQDSISDVTVAGGLDGLGNSTGGTFAFWLNVDWLNVVYFQSLITQGSDWDHGILIGSSSNFILELDLRYTDGTDDRYNMRLNLSAYADIWVHVAWVFDGDAQLIYAYINGLPAQEIYGAYSEAAAKAILPDVEGDDFSLYKCGWAALPFSATLTNDVRIYNRSLGAAEIFEIYQGRYANDTSLLLHYGANSIDVVDSIWYDLSDEENDGTLTAISVNATIGELYVRPIWDSYTVSFTVDDNRIDINTNATVSYTVISDYDAFVYDGTVNLNYTTWEQASFQRQGFTVSSLGGDDTYGITAIETNDADYIIWDEIEVYWSDTTDSRTNYNEVERPAFRLRLKYDNHLLNDGTNDGVNINGSAATWVADVYDYWYKNYNYASVTNYTFWVTSASENTYGITAFNTTSATAYMKWIVWDRVIVMGYNTNSTDNRDNINDCFNVSVWIQYEYDSTNVTDGTIVINGDSFAYNAGSGNWTALFSNATHSSATWNTIVAAGNTHGITYENQNSKSQTVIWDSLTIIMSDPTDQRDDLNANATGIVVSATYDQGGAYDGTLGLNNTDYNGDGTAVRWGYEVDTANGDDTYGITAISDNSDNTYMIWDSYTISFTVDDNRININVNATVGYTVISDYDAIAYDGTVNLNYTTWTQASAQRQGVTVSSLGGDDTYGITSISSNDDDYVIWDSLTVDLTDPTDQRIDINLNASGMVMSAVYDYDGNPYDGTLHMNDTDYDRATAVRAGYKISSADGDDTHGISVISDASDETYCIWDSLTVSITNPSDQRIDISANASGMVVSAVWDYDGNPYDGTLTLNDTTYNHGSVGIYYYTVDAGDGDDTHGITVVSSSDSVYCIFDRIIIVTTAVTDGRINYGLDNTTLNVTAKLEYDNHALGSGDTLYMNGTSMTWNTDHFYLVTGIYSIVDIINYFVNSSSANEATYGITVINLDGNSDDVIWDRVQVQSYTVTDSWVDVNENVNVDVLLYYDYDNSDVTDGTVTLNGNAMEHQGSGTWRYTTNEASPAANTYDTIAVSGNTYGITVEDQNGKSHEVLWDKIIWQSIAYVNTTQDYGSDGYRINEGVYVRITLQLQYEYNSTNLIDGTVTLNGESMTYNTTPGYWYLDVMNATSAYGQHYNFTTIVVSGNAQGITIENQNSQFLFVIWDEIVILTTTATDSYIDPTESTTINVTAQLRYDNHTVGSIDTLYMNDTSMTWEADHWYLTVGPYGGVYVLEFFVNSTNNNEVTYAITVIDVDGNSATIGSEQVKVISYAISDARDDVDDYIWTNVTLQYESDSAAVVDGTIVINGYDFSHLGSGIWRHNRTESTVVGRTFDTVVASGNARSITTVNQNGQSQLAIWDRIIILTTASTDGRIDYGTTTTLNVTATLEYAAHSLGSGDTLYMNDTSMTWDTDHWYITTGAYNIVDLINYFVNSSSANEATYGISGVNLDGNSADVIWDRIIITITVATDGRIDYGTTTTINVTATLEYSAHSLGSGDTLYMNDTSMTWDTDHFYITTDAYNIIDTINYFVNSSNANEVTYDITVLNLDGNSDDVIWDRIKILTTVTDDSRVGYDTQAIITATAELEYDSHALGTGDTLYMNGTQMTWNGTHFILNPQFTDVDIWSFYVNSTGANEDTHGITAINLDGNDVNQIWDRVAFTWNANMTWTIVNYYINVSFTAILEYDSATFAGNLTAGNCTITNSTTAFEVLTESPYENYTYYTTSVLDDVYGITSYINTVTAWCVFDNITATESHGVTVTEYSKTFFIYFGELQWQYNGSNIGIDWICLNMRNGTQTTTAITLSDSVLSPIKQEIYIPVAWDGVLYSNNATKTIGGRSYNFQWYSIEHSVMPSQTIVVENIRILDVTLVISGTTNVDFTWYIYDDGDFTDETDSVADANDFKIEFDRSIIYGWCNYSIYFDAGESGDRWYNNSYFNYFDLNIEIPEQVGDSMEIKGTSSVNCEWYIYNRDMSAWTGEHDSITGGNNYFQFLFTLQTASGKHNYSLYFNISATVYIWKNGTYNIAPTVLAITSPVYTGTEERNLLSGATNVACDWYAYNNDTQMDTGVLGVGSFAIGWDKNTTVGYYVWGVKFDDGTTERWVNGTFEIDAITLDIDIEDWGVEGSVIEIVGISNLDISWYVYNEGIYSAGETGSETEDIGFQFTFAKNTTIGKHNFSIYFNDTVDGSQYRWFNRSYTISAVYGYCQVSLYNSEGTGLDANYFIVYVNGTQYYGNEFYDRTDYGYNITVTDYFGYTIYSTTHDYDQHIDVGIAFYVYKVQSELQGQEVYFNLTRTGGARFSQHLLAGEILTYYLVAGEYTYEFKKVTSPGGDTYVYYEGTFTLSTDKTHIIDGTNLRDIENDIELIPTGKTDIKPLEASMSGVMSMISMMQLGMWGLAFLIVIGMAATATEDEITKDGKVIKKRKIPKQLKRFSFKRGAKNPKSKAIPKGAGRKSWKGIAFREDVEDWRDKM